MFKKHALKVTMVRNPDSGNDESIITGNLLDPAIQKLATEQLKDWGKKLLIGVGVVIVAVKVLETIDHITVAKIQNSK